MRLFADIAPDGGVTTVEMIVSRIKAQSSSMPGRWSLCELRPDEADYQFLRAWAAHLPYGVVKQYFRGDHWQQQSHMGLALLMLFAEVARREASEGTLWPHIRRGVFNHQTERSLFVQSAPKAELANAIERAVRRFHLRHVFDLDAGGQNYYNTVYLQFGFTRHGFQRNLGIWLSGNYSQAIRRLLFTTSLRSDSMMQLWSALRSRSPKLDDIIKSSPWVLPEWRDDLHEALSRQVFQTITDEDDVEIPILTERPQLCWEQAPVLEWHISSIETLSTMQDCILLRINGIVVAEMYLQESGHYEPLNPRPVRTPIIGHEANVELVSQEDGSVLQREFIPIFDREALVCCSNLGPKNLLFAAPGIRLSPEPLRRWSLPNQYSLSQMPKSEDYEAFEEGELVWSSVRGSKPPPETTLEIDWQEPTLAAAASPSIKVTHPSGESPLAIRMWGIPLMQVAESETVSVVGPLLAAAGTLPPTIQLNVLTAKGNRERSTLKRDPNTLKGILFRSPEGTWHSCEELNTQFATDIASLPLRYYPPKPLCGREGDEAHWLLFEGASWRGNVARQTRPRPWGWGAPLNLQERIYNSKERMRLCESCVDTGIIGTFEKERLTLRYPIILDPQRHRLVILRASGHCEILDAEQVVSSVSEDNLVWNLHLTSSLDELRMIAIAYDGEYRGSWWSSDFGTFFSSSSGVEAENLNTVIALLYWAKAPLLSSGIRELVRAFVSRNVTKIINAWLSFGYLPSDLKPRLRGADDGWDATLAVLLEDWDVTRSAKTIAPGTLPLSKKLADVSSLTAYRFLRAVKNSGYPIDNSALRLQLELDSASERVNQWRQDIEAADETGVNERFVTLKDVGLLALGKRAAYHGVASLDYFHRRNLRTAIGALTPFRNWLLHELLIDLENG
ncbi:hypothetical protein [Armatimonas rosea]|uniref:Uncharacterized protein n=1 Tax=Armatimonas rosea TaxID=685828 RepID=A0A7W9SW08_ARMRO|nr:hypothetical protein [Armatimonas rosea]MBB6053885.1 hypothetical protein [Armatimonas rosea]